jgi:hypothetical protein
MSSKLPCVLVMLVVPTRDLRILITVWYRNALTEFRNSHEECSRNRLPRVHINPDTQKYKLSLYCLPDGVSLIFPARQADTGPVPSLTRIKKAVLRDRLVYLPGTGDHLAGGATGGAP